ncbi:MAG: 30S ribosomal protein S17 [Candidatus Woesebacteria bacterium GW2011_GWA1_39_21]|uniref:Small ribosomal subunit protein uS17 n=1 Tax=Candidatus Woesebacteria bacterium GW2011_GWA1_39_21 TaxID=1618550 RepID=A0A0G0QMK0_9BACT|nr:MAG: 30S ribosomal protein S17 [Candidatus Woesebacteria bacterium GW2011_GWA1_39_21]
MKVYTGKVISKKMQKTATVLVESVFMHKLYGKRFKKSKKYHVHDEFNTQVGETVSFVDSKPYSKIKKWRIVTPKKTSGSKKIVAQKKSAKVKTKKK